ncbi:hypothetical protein A5675_15350 [Mycobacterium malmoense]|uniref:helix-turn-helix domain-containing protein n=1 Tax=Mycobacterium malmoense TaxID=1780 RepID=UPI00080B277F|nr:helix-turn-helix domain-containing protein [Mycobacterium malmoense]OCB38763.1 hypothetical protein A5675_15350 [Mycobacterium malmoense]
MSKKISMQEAADTYAVSTSTIRRYIATGRLTAYRVGPRMIRLDADQLERELVGPIGQTNGA